MSVDALKQRLTNAIDQGFDLGKELSGLLLNAPQPQAVDRTANHDEKQLSTAADSLLAANDGLSALAELKRQRAHRTLANPNEVEGLLLFNRAAAVLVAVQAHDSLLLASMDDEEAPEARDVDDKLGEFKAYRVVLDDAVERCKSTGTPLPIRDQLKPMLPKLIEGQLRCGRLMRSMYGATVNDRAEQFIHLTHKTGELDLVQLVLEFCEAANDRIDEVHQAVAALHSDAVGTAVGGARGAVAGSAQRLSPEKVDEYKALVEAYGDKLGRVGTHLCLAAAGRIEIDDDSEHWLGMLNLANAIADFQSSLKEVCDSVGERKPAAPATLDEWLPAAMPAKGAASAPAARPSGGASRKHRRPGKRSAGSSAAAPAPAPMPAPLDSRAEVQKQVDALLKKYPADRLAAARSVDDVVAVARALDKDTSGVESLMRDPRRDAVKTADFVRGSVRNWFGEPDRLRRAQASLPADDARIAQLTDRLRALELTEQRLGAWEADELKRDSLPRSNHLDRLLTGGQVERVDAPIRLPAPGDAGKRGTVFEICIQPKPLSDRKPAAALYVHLHTSELVEAAALSKMKFRDFARVHLKTAEERSLGPRWEAVMRALGYSDKKVHRAPIGATLLGELFARADAAAGSSSAQAH